MVGDEIRRRREEKGLSQEALAELVGVSRQAVGKWEQGGAMPAADNLERLEKALELKPGELSDLSQPRQSAAGKRSNGRLWKALAVAAGLTLAFALGRTTAGEDKAPQPSQGPDIAPTATPAEPWEEPDWLAFRDYPEAIEVPRENMANFDNAQSNIWYCRDGEDYLNEGPYGPWEWTEEPVTAGELTLALARRTESGIPTLYVLGRAGEEPWAILYAMAEGQLRYEQDFYGKRYWAKNVGNVLGYDGILLQEETGEAGGADGLVFALKDGEPWQVFRFPGLEGFADLDLDGEQEAVCRERYDGPYLLYDRDPAGFFRGTVGLPPASQTPQGARFTYEPEERAFGFMWEKAQYQYLEGQAPIYDWLWDGRLRRRSDNGRDTRFQAGLVDGTAVTFVPDGLPYGRGNYDPDAVLSYCANGTPQPTLRQLSAIALREVERLTGYRPERCFFDGERLYFDDRDNAFAGVCFGGEVSGGLGGEEIGSVRLTWKEESSPTSPLEKDRVKLPAEWSAMSGDERAVWWYKRLTGLAQGEVVQAELTLFGRRLTLADGRFYEMELGEDGYLQIVRGPYPEGSVH